VTYKQECPLTKDKIHSARAFAMDVAESVESRNALKLNVIWLEVTGCSGNIISLLNSENPSLYSILTNIVNFTFSNILMGAEGEFAFEKFLETLDTDFILLVDGAVSTAQNGFYTIVANYKGKLITALEAIKMAAEKAKYVVAVGTCASYGGISAAKPNPSESKSVQEILDRLVIKLPGCPCHPDWVVGTLAHLVGYGLPELDNENRPLLFYGVTIHDNCTRRGFFEKGIFAKNFGEQGCMIKLGCRGPSTRTDCPRKKWNGYVNWPIGDNTNCIGCAKDNFPDGTEPFVKY
jgi:hydrogenase small subunit